MAVAVTFRPTLWATVAALAVLAVLVGLGSWQLDRRVWKEQVLETRAQRLTAPAVAYSEIAAATDAALDVAEYRPIRLRGRYRPAGELKLLSRTRDGRAGFHVITPLVADGADGAGAVVLVDRGWVPIDGADALAPLPIDPVEVDGFVRRFETPGRFTPDNDPITGTWFYLDRDQIAAALKVDAVAPFYVQRAPGAAPSDVYPAGGVPDVALRNPHLQYAITWYSLAGALLVIYVIFHVRRRVGED